MGFVCKLELHPTHKLFADPAFVNALTGQCTFQIEVEATQGRLMGWKRARSVGEYCSDFCKVNYSWNSLSDVEEKFVKLSRPFHTRVTCGYSHS